MELFEGMLWGLGSSALSTEYSFFGGGGFLVCLLHCRGLQIKGLPKQTNPLLRRFFHPQLSGWDHSTEDVCFDLELELLNPDVLSQS